MTINDASKIYLGTTPVTFAFQGDVQVYPKNGQFRLVKVTDASQMNNTDEYVLGNAAGTRIVASDMGTQTQNGRDFIIVNDKYSIVPNRTFQNTVGTFKLFSGYMYTTRIKDPISEQYAKYPNCRGINLVNPDYLTSSYSTYETTFKPVWTNYNGGVVLQINSAGYNYPYGTQGSGSWFKLSLDSSVYYVYKVVAV